MLFATGILNIFREVRNEFDKDIESKWCFCRGLALNKKKLYSPNSHHQEYIYANKIFWLPYGYHFLPTPCVSA